MSASAYAGLDPCVHCGFCLPACPTYEVTADESDSPRGRIVLMRALARGEMAADDDALGFHLARCLGCRACESVCPSGVVFGPALEQARAEISRARPVPAAVRFGLWLLARPSRQRLLWTVLRLARATRVPALLAKGAGPAAPRLATLLAMLAATRPAERRGFGAPSAGTGPRRAIRAQGAAAGPIADAEVALFRGCVMDGLFRHVHDATIRVLAANGLATREVPGGVCCGALAAHAGLDDLARELARENVRAFDVGAGGVPVVTNSAGCGAMLKAYGEWLADDRLAERARALAARTRDVCEVLAERGPRPAGPLPLRVAYDAPCHLLYAQGVAAAPRAVLDAIPGLQHVAVEGSERCCGSAGLYSLLEPELAQQVLGAKLRAIADAGPDVVATGNPGCLMQIGAGAVLSGIGVEVRHPVELLDRAYGS